MKYTQKLVTWLVACVIALATVSMAKAETTESTVKIVRIKGSARYSTGKNVWQALEVGTVLKAGSIIQTASSSTVDLVIAEKGAKDKVTDTQLDLRAGRIFFAVKKVSAASTFEIKIPNGVAGIRGTLGSLSALGVCGCAQGSVGLAFRTTQGPATRIVDSGFQFDIRTGDFSRIAEILARELHNLPIEVHNAGQTGGHQQQPPPQVIYNPHTGLPVSEH